VANPLFLGLLLILLFLSALYSTDKSFTSEWIPILISFFDTSFYTREISIILSSLFILPLLFLIFVFISPESIYFSGSSFAAPLFLWSIYFTIQSKKSDLNCFISLPVSLFRFRCFSTPIQLFSFHWYYTIFLSPEDFL